LAQESQVVYRASGRAIATKLLFARGLGEDTSGEGLVENLGLFGWGFMQQNQHKIKSSAMIMNQPYPTQNRKHRF